MNAKMKKIYIYNSINPFYNKNVNDYDDDIEIHIEKTNNENVNKNSFFKSNLTLDTKFFMCHVSKHKYVYDISKLLMSMYKNDLHEHINEPYDKIVKFVESFNFKNNIKILKSLRKNHSNVELRSINDNLNPSFINNTYEKKNFIYECKNENINLPNQCKGENVFLDMVIDIHNPLSSKLTNTHNSIRNEVFLKFHLNDLQIKTFDEFVIDLLSSNSRKQKKIYI
jgi:hypothetical protein